MRCPSVGVRQPGAELGAGFIALPFEPFLLDGQQRVKAFQVRKRRVGERHRLSVRVDDAGAREQIARPGVNPRKVLVQERSRLVGERGVEPFDGGVHAAALRFGVGSAGGRRFVAGFAVG